MIAFSDRDAAGTALAEALAEFDFVDPVVLALPRGGVPVAVHVARALGAPLDLVMVRKIGVPNQPELAAGAIVDGANPEMVVNDHICDMVGLSRADLERLSKVQLEEIRRRREVYLPGRPHVPLRGKTAIVVDDGIATGATTRAALLAVRRQHPRKLVLAIPVAPETTVRLLERDVDSVVCLETPEPFHAIGAHYRRFDQLSDDEVVSLLRSYDADLRAAQPATDT